MQGLTTGSPGFTMLQVYSLACNARDSRLFLSAGADWTVKVWETARPKVCVPLLALPSTH